MKTNEEIAIALYDILYPRDNNKGSAADPIGKLGAVASGLAHDSDFPENMRERFDVIAREAVFCYAEVKELVAALEKMYCAQQALLSFSKNSKK